MHALPALIAALIAALLAEPLLRAMVAAGHVRENYRGRSLAFPFGALIAVAALAALVPVALAQRLGAGTLLHPETLLVGLYCLGVAALGLLDDALGGRAGGDAGAAAPRGVRAHAAAALRGQLSTGAIKACCTAGLALLVAAQLPVTRARWLLAAAVLVLATHVFNLLDVRPGRSGKVFVLLLAGIAVGTRQLRPLWAVGLFAAPALVACAFDLRERALLGDTGASVLGALAGLVIVLGLAGVGQLVALCLLLIAAIYGELRSISALVARTPLLRELDSWGKPS
jgi:UDP-GlcNAc:undecaprenyl-phosphate GlcNAc-1-phosphate transferase